MKVEGTFQYMTPQCEKVTNLFSRNSDLPPRSASSPIGPIVVCRYRLLPIDSVEKVGLGFHDRKVRV